MQADTLITEGVGNAGEDDGDHQEGLEQEADIALEEGQRRV